MYLARFEFGDEKWVQGCLLFPHACSTGTDAWAQRLSSVVTFLAATPQLRTSYRLEVAPETICRAIIVSAPGQHEAPLRRALALFSRLELLADESVISPATRGEYDRILDRFGHYQALIAAPEYHSRTAWLASDFRLAPALAQLAQQASDLGFSFTYHANFEPLGDPLELARATAHNLVRLESEPGAPPTLVDTQRSIAERLRNAIFLCEELVGANSIDATEWLSASLKQMSSRTSQVAETAEFTFAADAHDSSIYAARHRVVFEELSTSELASSAVTREEWQKLLSWNPPQRFYDSWKHAVPAVSTEVTRSPDAATLAALERAPKPYDGAADYIFISYKHQDMSRIVPILRKIADLGYRLWYDKGIPGGAEWDALIEERVQNCKLLMLFVSQAAVESRYVRREVKFADSLAKPLLSIKLEEPKLGRGMQMLLNQYQTVSADAPDFIDEMEHAINYVRQL
jgi:TIR domain